MKKKILGYIFISISVILALALIAQLPSFLASVVALLKVFSEKASSYDTGYVVGSFLVWVVHLVLIALLWKYGRRWSKNEKKIQSN